MVKYINVIEATNGDTNPVERLSIYRDPAGNLYIQISHVECGKDKLLSFRVAPADEDVLAEKFSLMTRERPRT
jgi:hypothetical protein